MELSLIFDLEAKKNPKPNQPNKPHQQNTPQNQQLLKMPKIKFSEKV